MTNSLRFGAMAVALLGTVGVAVAQAPNPAPRTAPGAPGSNQSTSPNQNQKVQLSATQKSAIYNAVSKDRPKSISSPPNFQPLVGAKVPPSMELHTLPPEAVANAGAASSLRYAMINNQVLLVDPLTMEVVDIIRQ